MNLVFFLLGLIIGILSTLLYFKKDKPVLDISKKIKPKNIVKSKYPNIEMLLNEIRNTGTLPIEIKPIVMRSLVTIANTPDWETKLDKESIKNLNKIYEKWQGHLKSTKSQTQKVGKSMNMEAPKYWEGTLKEYEAALSAGVIDDNTVIEIIDEYGDKDSSYHGSWLTHNDDGSVEEFMD